MNHKVCIAVVLMAMIVCAHGSWFSKALSTVGNGIKTGASTAGQFLASPTGQQILSTGLALAAGDEELQALKELRAEDEFKYNLIADMIVLDADVGPVVAPRLRQQLDEITKPDHVMELLDIVREA